MKTMLYLKGKMGRGKSKISTFLMKVQGLNVCLPLSNDSVFTTQFNGPLMGKTLCILDEIVHDFDDFKTLYNQLKPYITEGQMTYRNVFEKAKSLKNVTSFIMTGNYDMLKLDSPQEGDDRRLKSNDISDVVKDAEYCKKLDAFCDDEDVMYAFFWDCVDNHNKNFNELEELKTLPVSETKKTMIQQALDTATQFLKAIVNENKLMDKYIKPKDLYKDYINWIATNETLKKPMNSTTFLSKMKNYSTFVSFHENKTIDGQKTNWVFINKKKMITYFHQKSYWNEYDDICIEKETETKPETKTACLFVEEKESEVDQLQQALEEIKKLKQENELLRSQIQSEPKTEIIESKSEQKIKSPAILPEIILLLDNVFESNTQQHNNDVLQLPEYDDDCLSDNDIIDNKEALKAQDVLPLPDYDDDCLSDDDIIDNAEALKAQDLFSYF
ncbi:DUF5906 domain-containing protein [Clostridium sp.]|uniref:primase-helicase family protein n=1 Tax=Clostridium sp. TaxID=1506 RepID=UPI0028468070|nr:DUF5906 domain-containing protein [Clostridium sp.]MDR3598616.1 DUF5906 domain-containing protein [Clostridium sp.]